MKLARPAKRRGCFVRKVLDVTARCTLPARLFTPVDAAEFSKEAQCGWAGRFGVCPGAEGVAVGGNTALCGTKHRLTFAGSIIELF